MKNRFNQIKMLLLFATLTLIFVSSCGKENRIVHRAEGNTDSYMQAELVPLEDALEILDQFLEKTGNAVTKAGEKRVIESVETHYPKTATKSDDDLPDAYIINFENNGGYAVLGANSSVTPIVAVTFNGHLVEGFLDANFKKDSLTYDVDGNLVDLSTIDPYSEEYDDYYVMVEDSTNLEFLQGIINNGLDWRKIDEGATLDVGGGSTRNKAEVDSLLNFCWSQGSWDERTLYNRYCYKVNWRGDTTYVYTGCSTTALAQIVAYNQYPDKLTINKDTIDFNGMTSSYSARGLSNKGKDQVGLLMGAIFHNVGKIFRWESGTCITPEQIKQCMEELGYTDVVRMSSSSFDDDMQMATSNMLEQGKPVFLSAMSSLFSGHSWVVTGAAYQGYTWMLSCNWGWGGPHNGFFSSQCFDPDREGTEHKQYTWHFRLITYSIPNQCDEYKAFNF